MPRPLRGIFPVPAVITAKELVGFGVVEDPFLPAVPLNAVTNSVAEHPKQADVGGEMPDFDIADGAALLLDGIQ